MITPEDLEELLKNASDEDMIMIRQMLDEVEFEEIIPKPSKSMSTDQYARSREEQMLERMPLKESGVEKIEDDEDDSLGLDIIMYSDSIGDDEDDEVESSSPYYTDDELESQIDILKELENSIEKGLKDGKWYAHESIEGGNKTIAYGHKITDEERDSGVFDDGLTEEEAIELLKKDIDEANRKIRAKIDNFDSFPYYLRQELVNSTYRNLLNNSPDTLDFINDGDFEAAAVEFTNKVPAYRESAGIRKRMDRVVDALRKYAQELDD